jgi:AmiR/NasT family two-component response regulator
MKGDETSLFPRGLSRGCSHLLPIRRRLRRFAEYHDLEGAFGRRAIAECAKGILMERHSIDEATAFEMLREHSRDANRKLFDVAAAVVDGHRLLPKHPRAPT